VTQDYSNPDKDPEVVDQLNQQKLQSLNTVGMISYVLHLIVALGALIPGGQFGPVLLIAALVIDMIKRSDAEGTWHASHFSWRIRTVIVAALLYLVTVPLWLIFIFPGWLAWCAISVWFLYRIVMGMSRMNKGLAMEFPE
jgi:uncharacterized membrane protein